MFWKKAKRSHCQPIWPDGPVAQRGARLCAQQASPQAAHDENAPRALCLCEEDPVLLVIPPEVQTLFIPLSGFCS